MHQGYKSRGQVGPLGRKAVLVPNRSILIWNLLEHTRVHETLEPIRQNVLCDPKFNLKLSKASDTSEHIPED